MKIETLVYLDSDELLTLRQRLAFDGPGSPAIDSALDAKLYEAQVRIEDAKADSGLSVVV
jgi:hypothetical protein